MFQVGIATRQGWHQRLRLSLPPVPAAGRGWVARHGPGMHRPATRHAGPVDGASHGAGGGRGRSDGRRSQRHTPGTGHRGPAESASCWRPCRRPTAWPAAPWFPGPARAPSASPSWTTTRPGDGTGTSSITSATAWVWAAICRAAPAASMTPCRQEMRCRADPADTRSSLRPRRR